MSMSEPGIKSFKQRGTLLVVVLFILLAITILGLSATKASGLQMQMSSNSGEQLAMLEAAEYVVAQIANELHALGGIGGNSLTNVDCEDLCFDETCSGGYCFFGATAGDPSSWHSCAVGLPVQEPSQEAAVWADGSGRHKVIMIPDAGLSAKYIIEFRCYAAADASVAMDDANNTQLYRITTLVASKSGRAGVMLRVTVKNQ